MIESKLEAFLDRQEIRDVFDMEFLFKKGVPIEASLLQHVAKKQTFISLPISKNLLLRYRRFVQTEDNNSNNYIQF